jgi:hypothetical protein
VKALLIAALLAGGCASGDKGMGTSNPGGGGGSAAVVVETIDQAVAAKGKLARVRGTAQREKMGDTIKVQELTVHCLDVRFPDDRIGTQVEAEGTLEVGKGFAATTNDKGEISQGTGDGDDTRWLLRGCALK